MDIKTLQTVNLPTAYIKDNFVVESGEFKPEMFCVGDRFLVRLSDYSISDEGIEREIIVTGKGANSIVACGAKVFDEHKNENKPFYENIIRCSDIINIHSLEEIEILKKNKIVKDKIFARITFKGFEELGCTDDVIGLFKEFHESTFLDILEHPEDYEFLFTNKNK